MKAEPGIICGACGWKSIVRCSCWGRCASGAIAKSCAVDAKVVGVFDGKAGLTKNISWGPV